MNGKNQNIEPQIIKPKILFKITKGLIIKIGVAIIIVLVLAGATLATRIWDPLWSPFRPEPEDVMTEMINNMREIKAMHSKIKIDVKNLDSQGEEKGNVSLEINNSSDEFDEDNIKSEGSLSLVYAVEGMQISASADFKKVDGISFLRITTIPVLPIPIDLSFFKNQWVKLSEASQESESSAKEKIIDLFQEENIYSIKQELPDEKINNKRTYHYLLSLTKGNLNKLMEGISGTSLPAGLPLIEGQNLEDISDSVTENIDDLEVEVWIGKRDNLIYKIKIYKEIESKDSGDKNIVNIEFEFSNFNESLNVEAPENSKTMQEIFTTSSLLLQVQEISL